MSEVVASAHLPGLVLEAPAPAPPKEASSGRPRVKTVDRSQCVLRPVDLERLIEEDHPARAIWDLTGRLDLQAFYRPIEAVEGVAGRTPHDPRLLISLWIYAYSRGISSGREIERRCGFDPGFGWLCGMEPINHHTLSDFRKDHGAGLQELFVEILAILSAQGLVSLERVMHDGTKVEACAGADTFRREKTLQAYLEAARQQVQSLAQEPDEGQSKVQQAARQRAAREREQRVEQALAELKEIRETKTNAQEKQEARASTTDPSARNMKQAGGGYAASYNVQISTEASHKIVVATGISQNSSDFGELLGGVARVEENCQAKVQQVVADGGFTSRENILTMAERGTDFIGSLGDQQAKGANGLKHYGIAAEFSGEAFSYDAAQNLYRCPAGQALRPNGRHEGRSGVVSYRYRAERSVCQACQFKTKCCPQSNRGRSVSRLVEAAEVKQFRQKMQSAQAQEIYRQRAPVAEFPNAWIKEKLGLRRFRLRGLKKVGLEVIWACLTYNIQQWIRLCWRPSLVCTQT
jgi:transposase